MEVDYLRARFNVNSLLATDPAAAIDFETLCAKLGIPESSVTGLLAALVKLKPPPPVPGETPAPPAWMADASELADYGLPIRDYPHSNLISPPCRQVLTPSISTLRPTRCCCRIWAIPSCWMLSTP